MEKQKLQSAMEYLMTYGWAILIIAVVLGALFGLGFFSSASLAPKIAAGACQVYLPYGPGTTASENLAGTCNNELPQYVGYFPGHGFINVSNTGLPLVFSPRSVFAWFYLPNSPVASTPYYLFTYGTANHLNQSSLQVYGTGNGASLPETVYVSCYQCSIQSSLNLVPGTWNFVGYTLSGVSSGTITMYLNGQSWVSGGNQNNHFKTSPGLAYLGSSSGGNGVGYSIADLQVYNTSLTANEITALYDEGIGGVPININNLVGWWPLNGNPNDYSGDLNNGVATNVIFTSSWTSGYTAP